MLWDGLDPLSDWAGCGPIESSRSDILASKTAQNLLIPNIDLTPGIGGVGNDDMLITDG
jgi:hypothetical protein